MRHSRFAAVWVVALAFAGTTSAQSTYTWTFDGNPGSGVVGTGNPANPANITLSNFTRTGVEAANGPNLFNSSNWSLGTSLDPTKSVGFTIAPTSGRVLHLTSLFFERQQSLGTGPTSAAVRLLSGAGVVEQSATIDLSGSGTATTFDFTDTITTDTINFQVYGWNASSANGTLRVDNVALTYSPTASVPLLADNIGLVADTRLYAQANAFTLGGVISGGFNLSKEGAATVTLTGNNTYTGTTTVSGGTLQVGNGGASGTLGTGAVTVGAGGTLAFNRSDSVTVANAIGGAGQVVHSGTGTTTLTATNTYTGGTTVSAGTLRLGASNVLADAGKVTLAGGNLSTGATTGFSDTLGQLAVTSSASKIVLGTGAHNLTFSSFDSAGFAGLTIEGWTGTAGSPGSGGRIFFADVSGLTSGVLSNITFAGYAAGATVINGTELVPVPEPATVLGVAALALAGAAGVRRVRRAGATV
ncbi:MAG TPA: autotransporter-associated beta strand repeat-containing protein [Gemmata sp.]|nr:autotransporter-associated beta strand repeat-containing protein [Gemmata sp.]